MRISDWSSDVCSSDLLADIVLRIDDRDDHVRTLDRRQRLDDRELFPGFPDARLAADAGGVDQRVRPAVIFERHRNRITRGAREIRRQHALLAAQTIDQRRLAAVGPVDERYAPRAG